MISARRKACSDAVARPSSAASAARRAPCEPAPLNSASAANATSTSETVKEGDAAGGGSSFNDAHPTPSTRWRGVPARYPAPAARSDTSSPCRAAASRATLSLRPLSERTSSVAAASSANSTPDIQ